MILSHDGHSKAIIKRASGGIPLCHYQRKLLRALLGRPIRGGPQQDPSRPLPPKMRANLQRVQHCMVAMARYEGSTRRAVA